MPCPPPQTYTIHQPVSRPFLGTCIAVPRYVTARQGVLYSDQGQLPEAEAIYQRALQGEEKMLGPDHTLTLMTVNNLSLLYWNQGRLQEAKAIYRRVPREIRVHPCRLNTFVLDLPVWWWSSQDGAGVNGPGGRTAPKRG